MKATVKRVEDSVFSVVTNELMSDCKFHADYGVELVGNQLKSKEEKFSYRVRLMTINLGPESLAKVQSLEIGESVELGK